MRGKFYGIGVGPGDPELLTVKAASILKSCPHLFVPKASADGGSVALEIARRYVRPDAQQHELVFPMTSDPVKLSERWKESAEAVAAVLETGSDACFLTLGDPLVYSTYIYLLRALNQLIPGLEAITVPGITSFCAGAALTNFPLGEGKAPVTIVPTADDLAPVRRAFDAGGTVVLMKIGKRLPDIVALLSGTNLLEHSVLIARAGLDGQRVVLDLRNLPPEDPEIGYLSVILVHADRGIALCSADRSVLCADGKSGLCGDSRSAL
jgi:precorrin-2/cobalt-factor-2 C20-methyltransferase